MIDDMGSNIERTSGSNSTLPLLTTQFTDSISKEFRQTKDFNLDGHQISFGELKDGHGSVVVCIDGKECGKLSSGYGLGVIGEPILIGDEIYFRHGTNYEKIADGEISTLENISNVYNFDDKPVLIEWNSTNKTSSIQLGDKKFGEYKLLYDIYGKLVGFDDNINFNIDMSKNEEHFGFVGETLDNKKVFVTESEIYGPYDEIEFDLSGNYPILKKKDVSIIELQQYGRHKED